jgi:hypothetical protein
MGMVRMSMRTGLAWVLALGVGGAAIAAAEQSNATAAPSRIQVRLYQEGSTRKVSVRGTSDYVLVGRSLDGDYPLEVLPAGTPLFRWMSVPRLEALLKTPHDQWASEQVIQTYGLGAAGTGFYVATDPWSSSGYGARFVKTRTNKEALLFHGKYLYAPAGDKLTIIREPAFREFFVALRRAGIDGVVDVNKNRFTRFPFFSPSERQQIEARFNPKDPTWINFLRADALGPVERGSREEIWNFAYGVPKMTFDPKLVEDLNRKWTLVDATPTPRVPAQSGAR